MNLHNNSTETKKSRKPQAKKISQVLHQMYPLVSEGPERRNTDQTPPPQNNTRTPFHHTAHPAHT